MKAVKKVRNLLGNDGKEADFKVVEKTITSKDFTPPIPLKETQGHRKILQFIEDLARNKQFQKDYKKYLKERQRADKGFTAKTWEHIFGKYVELGKVARRALKKYQKNYDRAASKMADVYGLDNNLLTYMMMRGSEVHYGVNLMADFLDMCFFESGEDAYLLQPHDEIPLVFDPLRRRQWEAYPISLRIHRYASKNDVLDYIEKNWASIYETLGAYTDYKGIRIRKRKLDRKITDFIWANRARKGKEIKKLLDEKFPKNGLVYYEIPKIISIEKERRLS